jgi:hypothetical protein
MRKSPIRMMVLGTVLAAAACAPARAQPIPVYVNGERLAAEARLVPGVGRTVLPMRVLFESLGAQVAWDAQERAAYAWTDHGRGVRIAVGSRQAELLEMSPTPAPGDWGRVTSTYPLDTPAQILNGRTYIPLRFASEALEGEVRYLAAEPAIHISTERVAGFRAEMPPRAAPPPAAPAPRGLNVRLELPAERFSLAEHESIPLRFSVINTAARPLALEFSSGQMYDFEVRRNGELVWNWAHDRFFTQALQRREVPAGEGIEFTESWNLRNNEGEPVPPGQYTLRAVLTTMGPAARPAVERTITITE